jgi:hypothetical protein
MDVLHKPVNLIRYLQAAGDAEDAIDSMGSHGFDQRLVGAHGLASPFRVDFPRPLVVPQRSSAAIRK